MGSNSALLLIEDSEDDALLMTRALRKAGVESRLQVVTTGQEALDYFASHGQYSDRSAYPLPAIVFLDLKLPRVPGLEMLKWIRATPETRALIVIVLTSSNLPSDVSKAYELGANSYVVKPPTFDQLTDFAQVFKDYWLRYNSTLAPR